MENVLDKAREAGMAVLLDACIGQQRFHSVVGSEATLQRFAGLCEMPVVDRATLSDWVELCEQGDSTAVAAAIRSALAACEWGEV